MVGVLDTPGRRQSLVTSRNRSCIETIATILDASRTGVRKTQIVLNVRTNSVRTAQLLRTLRRLGLIAEQPCEPEGSIYITTGRGFEFLRYYEKLAEYLQDDAL